MTICVSRQTHKYLKTFVVTIFVPCQTHKFLKMFVMTIYVSRQTQKFLKRLSWPYTCHVRLTNSKNVCHDHIRVISDSQIPKNVCHDHLLVMSNSQIPKNVCHDHIRVMSDSQIPKNVCHDIYVSCQTHKFLNILSWPYTYHVRLTNS